MELTIYKNVGEAVKVLLIGFFLLTSMTTFASVTFSGQAAKDVVDSLSGSKVEIDIGMSTRTTKGESIICDSPNNPDDQMDLDKYSCTIRFNSNGKILAPNY